ncbi:hypothetical protein ILUMI_12277 [Ignelater luminosus]|uniref:Mutator-like transposase domain-containing protein n=1 Tax=Ignelater luminosus TaxID=2038154 RepID=A0A8K0GD39_IGNLU|nr:hypothetical protein ILUMI_12277 [Ignelater luminosus]
MGNATKREKEGARGAQKLSSKRKSRRNIALRMQAKEHARMAVTEDDNSQLREGNGELRKEEGSTCTVTGRRMFNVNFLFKQILNGERHKPFDCSIIDMTVESERRNGLLSTFVLKCKFCSITQKLFNENIEDTNKFHVNSAITLAAISTGIGYSQIEEVAAGLNMPIMSDKTYEKYHEKVAVAICQTAWDIMEKAGKKEAELARQLGEVDRNNIPYITVVTDGAWSKRSYNVNYDAKSGVVLVD